MANDHRKSKKKTGGGSKGPITFLPSHRGKRLIWGNGRPEDFKEKSETGVTRDKRGKREKGSTTLSFDFSLSSSGKRAHSS